MFKKSRFFRFSERRILFLTLNVLFIVFLITYPWPFMGDKIAHQQNIILNNSINDDEKFFGCPLDYKWCEWTNVVNMPIFLGSFIFALGIFLPKKKILGRSGGGANYKKTKKNFFKDYMKIWRRNLFLPKISIKSL